MTERQEPAIYGPSAWSFVRTFMIFAFVGLLETALLLWVAPAVTPETQRMFAQIMIFVWAVLCPTFFFLHRRSAGQETLDDPLAVVLLSTVPLLGTVGAAFMLRTNPDVTDVHLVFLLSWAVIPPAWFVYESYEFHPKHKLGSYEEYKEGRASAAALWLAGVTLTTSAMAAHKFPSVETMCTVCTAVCASSQSTRPR